MSHKDWSSVDKTIQELSLLKHPFYQNWSKGALLTSDLKCYGAQYYHLESRFPRFLSRVHSNCDDLAVRQRILENIIDEEKGSDNHAELWLRFAEGLGLGRSEVLGAPCLSLTKRCLESLAELVGHSHWPLGLAALYAYESQIPEIARVKMDGLKQFYGVEDQRALQFYVVHQDMDRWHSQVERDLIVSSQADLSEVRGAAEKACRALWEFLDGVYLATCLVRGRASNSGGRD